MPYVLFAQSADLSCFRRVVIGLIWAQNAGDMVYVLDITIYGT
jgi:hypothetical protein